MTKRTLTLPDLSYGCFAGHCKRETTMNDRPGYQPKATGVDLASTSPPHQGSAAKLVTDYERGLRDGREAERREVVEYLRSVGVGYQRCETPNIAYSELTHILLMEIRNSHHRKEHRS